MVRRDEVGKTKCCTKAARYHMLQKYLYLVIGMSSPSKDSHNISPSSIRDPNLEFKKDRQNKN